MSGRVFVTGATGVLGRAAVPRLVADGWRVSGVARSDAAAARLRDAGAEPVTVELFDPVDVAAALAEHDAVLHLATHIPPLARMARRREWATNDRLRVDGTRNLLDAARLHGIARVVKESVTFPYRDGGDRWLDEDAPRDDADAWRATIEGERLVQDFTSAGGAGVVLRFGVLYGAGARSTDEYRTLARVRLAPLPGRAGAFTSSTHAEDAATAISAALTGPPGVYNVVDDRPLTRREYADAVAAALGARPLHLIPGSLVRALGGAGARGLVASQRVTNARFREATGWAPRFVDARAGWRAIAGARVIP